MPIQLTDDMKAVIASARLCFAATVSPDGRPNLSPKGTIRVWDDGHLFFLDIASPGTRRNLRHNPWIELNVVDQLSRRGYRFLGRATLHEDDEVYRTASRRVFDEGGAEFPVTAVVRVEVERALPIVSPGYSRVRDEWQMRELWRGRRVALEEEFETHLRTHGPWSENRR